MENSNITWTHNTQNFWLGCDKVAPECAHCYIERTLRQQGREPWGQLYKTKTWNNPAKWQKQAERDGVCYRVFTNSLSDFFHVKADGWREEAWNVIRKTPNLVWLILTKRPELIAKRLPKDWGEGYPNVWLGTSVGCNLTLNKLDSLRKISVHPQAVRFISCEPLLEDIADKLNLDGFRWLIVGGESGGGKEYLWDNTTDWRKEFDTSGRRTMRIEWARRLLEKSHATGVSFFFKQVTSFRSGVGEDALGQVFHEFPGPPHSVWADKTDAAAAEPVVVNISSAAPTVPEIISSKTQPEVSNATNVANEEEIEHLEKEIDEKATEIIGQFASRIEYELLPLLYRMKGLLPHGEWGNWFERFRRRVRFQWTMRTVQRKFKELEDGWNEDPPSIVEDDGDFSFADEQPDEAADAPAFTVYESPKDSLRKRLKEIHTVLSRGVAPVDANPVREDARRVDLALQLLEETLLAIDEGLFDKLPEDCGGCQHLHRGIVTLANKNPDWTDERLADETKTSLVTIRQARTRFATWGNDEHE